MDKYTTNIEKGRSIVTLPAHLLPVGIHTMRVVYNQSEHYYTCETGKHALIINNYNKNIYDGFNWTGNPIIDADNRKITIKGSNITYLKQVEE